MEIRRICGALGAEITGVDLRHPDLDFGAVYRAFLEHEVIFFREVHLTAEEHLALGRRFGTPSIYPVARLLGATEPTMTVIEDGPDSPNRADRWHTDVTWTQTPPKAALLHMELVPEIGGDTLWASATRAYETLSPRVKDFFCSLTVVHSNEGFLERVAQKAGDKSETIIEAIKRDYGPVEHPLVRTHPETGKRALLYAEQFIDHVARVGRAESDMVLNFLREHVNDVSLHCRWQWQAGDLAIWDERSTLHRAAADHFPQRRIIRRLEIDGDRPYYDPNRLVVPASDRGLGPGPSVSRPGLTRPPTSRTVTPGPYGGRHGF